MLTVAVLGPLKICSTAGQTKSTAVSLSVKEQALLSYLMITGKQYARYQLAGLFWGSDPEDKAKNSLRVALTHIRQLDQECIHAKNRQRVAFNKDAIDYCDLIEFDQIISTLPKDDDEPTIAKITRAIELYRGNLLAGLYVPNAPDFQNWLEVERGQRRKNVLALFERQTSYMLSARRYDEAQNLLQSWLQIESWNEKAHQQMMITLSRLGDFNGALAQYEICQQRLQDEIGVSPMPETVQLLERIKAARSGRPCYLPTEITPLIGRTSEINQLHQLLIASEHRLVTVIGLGGMGKTSLALHVAKQLYQEQAITFLNGVFFISLLSIRTLEHLLSNIAYTLEISLNRNIDSLTQIVDALRNKELLLVLDDWDTLTYSLQKFGSSRTSEGTDLIHKFLTNCPNIKILITSREPLMLRFEKRLELKGLDIPPDDAISIDEYSAVQLFLRVAEQVAPNFRLTDENRPDIIQICKMLDGMPLGIELAAAWLRVLPCKRIVAEITDLDFLSTDMQDVPERQSSLRTMFDYSWQMMTEDEREVFQRLAVFADGFTEAAATSVAGLTPQVLTSLFDRSLIKRDMSLGSEFPTRYSLHNAVRQYCAEKMAVDSTLQYKTRQKHCHFYADFIQHEQTRLYSPEHSSALALMGQEKQNVLAAWSWALHYIQLEELDKIIDAVEEYFTLAGPYREAALSAQLSAEYLCEVLEKSEEANPDAQILLGKIWAYQAKCLCEIGEFDTVIFTSQELLTLAREIKNVELQAKALLLCGTANHQLGKTDLALEQLEESLRLAQNASLPLITAENLRRLGVIYQWRADYDKVREFITEELTIRRAIGDRRGEMTGLNNLGVFTLQSGDYINALRYYSDGLNLFAQIGDSGRHSHMLNNIGRLYSEQRDFTKAAAYIEEALQVKRTLGDKLGESNALLSFARNYMFLGEYELAHQLNNDALTIKRTLGDWRGEAEALTLLALVCCLRGDHLVAFEYTTQANTILEKNTARFIQAQMLTTRSHILLFLKHLPQAQAAALDALGEWRARKNANLSMEPLADLAQIELLNGNEQKAVAYVNEILTHLETGNLDGVNFPLRVHLICYKVLKELDDIRSEQLLEIALSKLKRWSAAIEDEQLRQSYLSIAHHRQLLELSRSH